MNKRKVKKLKRELSVFLERTPTKSEFRTYKKHRDPIMVLKKLKTLALPPVLRRENIWKPIELPKKEPEKKRNFYQRVIDFIKKLLAKLN